MSERLPFTIWFTGLPSSGKSALARLVEARIRERGFPVMGGLGEEPRSRSPRSGRRATPVSGTIAVGRWRALGDRLRRLGYLG